MELELLLEKNPWWKGPEHFEREDPDYLSWKEKKIRWIPKVIKEIGLTPFSLNFVFGPRQVGKTTALKLLVKELLETKKQAAKSIFYFRCDEIADYRELDELLRTYIEFREREKITSSVILLDEITFPREWWRTIKSFIDDGIFKRDVLIVTGSAGLEVKKEADYFPGRRGHGKDLVVWPLSFREFVDVVDRDFSQKLTGTVSKDIVHLKEANRLLLDYFQCGGFPLAINSYLGKGYVDEEVKNTYLTWIKNDIAKTGKDARIAREVIKSVLTKMPSTLSWEGISKEMSIKSPKTVSSYVHVLSDIFIIVISQFIDPDTTFLKFGKNKKLHFTDPLYFHMFEEWCLAKMKEKESIMAESVLASHLYRNHKSGVFYWKNGEEVDCVIRKESGDLVGYECKWRETAKERKPFLGKMKEVWTVSKKDFGPRMVPLSLFLYDVQFE